MTGCSLVVASVMGKYLAVAVRERREARWYFDSRPIVVHGHDWSINTQLGTTPDPHDRTYDVAVVVLPRD